MAIESASSLEKAALQKSNDPFREARAYNLSIYIMVGMPYLLLGTFGFLIYRGLKKNALMQEHMEGEEPITDKGDPSCPTTSPDDDLSTAP